MLCGLVEKDAKQRYQVISRHPGVLFALLHKLDPRIKIRHVPQDYVDDVVTKESATELRRILEAICPSEMKKWNPRSELVIVHGTNRERDGTIKNKFIAKKKKYIRFWI